MRMRSLLLTVATVLTIFLDSPAQSEQKYKDPGGQYQIDLLGDWRSVTYNDAVGRPRTDFVYRDRREGLLKITKEPRTGASLQDMVRTEEETLRTYRPGFERATTESFGGGALRGLRLSFYSTNSGRQVASTHYYLEDGETVWVLRFVGRRGAIDAIRNVTDQMARSFQLIK
jgi:hypothetical protein